MSDTNKLYCKNIVNLIKSMHLVLVQTKEKWKLYTGYTFIKRYLFKKKILNLMAKSFFPGVESLAIFFYQDQTVVIQFKHDKKELSITVSEEYCIFSNSEKYVLGYHLSKKFWENYIWSLSKYIIDSITFNN